MSLPQATLFSASKVAELASITDKVGLARDAWLGADRSTTEGVLRVAFRSIDDAVAFSGATGIVIGGTYARALIDDVMRPAFIETMDTESGVAVIRPASIDSYGRVILEPARVVDTVEPIAAAGGRA